MRLSTIPIFAFLLNAAVIGAAPSGHTPNRHLQGPSAPGTFNSHLRGPGVAGDPIPHPPGHTQGSPLILLGHVKQEVERQLDIFCQDLCQGAGPHQSSCINRVRKLFYDWGRGPGAATYAEVLATHGADNANDIAGKVIHGFGEWLKRDRPLYEATIMYHG